MAHIQQEPPSFLTSSLKNSQLKITQLVCKFTAVVVFLYALYFWLAIEQSILALINLVFVFAYCIPLIFIRNNLNRLAKIWFFSVLIGHLFLLTTHVFTPETGFHFYYLLLPSGVFLLFDEKETLDKIAFMFLGIGLFFICEHYPTAPAVVLSEQTEMWIFSSTIAVIILELATVMFIFSKNIAMREHALKKLASLDPLTELYNRRSFLDIAEQLYSIAQRQNSALCVVIMDIDFFKQVNDTFGHIAGDKTLKNVAEQLKENIRKSDLLARYGGEEFILLLPDTDETAAIAVAESIRKAVEELQTSVGDDKSVACTLSLGIAQNSDNTESLQALIKLADGALYRAKDQGRNRVVY